MNRKLVLAMSLAIVLIGMLGVALKVQRVKASAPISINADGSINPPSAPISSSDNITYTFTDNINDFIMVYRNNIVVDGAGYTLQGTGSGTGIELSGMSNVTIKNMEIKGFLTGINVWHSSNISISGNDITENSLYGIRLYEDTDHNTISGNNITNNAKGIYFEPDSLNNFIHHNNFVNNTEQLKIYSPSTNVWDDGVEGNYWSNYTGVDLDHDGIGDTSHVLDANNEDDYPLMGMFHSFNASPGYNVNVISNSTIEEFTFFESNSTIKMYVSNSSATQSFGFCRVCIPKGLISPPYMVIIDGGSTLVLYFNGTVHDNDTHRWIYFAYEHSTHEVDIVPEFPTWTSMLLMFVVLTVAITIYKRRLLKTSIQ